MQEDTAYLMSTNHYDEEIIAQSICSALVGVAQGWIYAVERSCGTGSPQTCTEICTDPDLHAQDDQTVDATWLTAAAIHVYYGRPSTSPGNLGLKVYRYSDVSSTGCGPNFCCCFVPQ